MRYWIVLVALILAACATAQTPAPPLPTVQATLPPDNSAQNPTPLDSQPTQEPVQTQSEATPDGSTLDPDAAATATMQALQLVDLPTLSAASAVQNEIQMMPPPGTIERAPQTEEPDPGATPVPFYSITYEETGGPARSSLSIEIFRDGRVLRDGQEMTVGMDVILGAEQAIRDLGFFEIEGTFTQLGADPDVYSYMVRVELGDGSAKRLEAHDRVAPPELLRLFSQLRTIGL
jgi:hypothetical protein